MRNSFVMLSSHIKLCNITLLPLDTATHFLCNQQNKPDKPWWEKALSWALKKLRLTKESEDLKLCLILSHSLYVGDI